MLIPFSYVLANLGMGSGGGGGMSRKIIQGNPPSPGKFEEENVQLK